MRRTVCFAALVAASAFFATPASAQISTPAPSSSIPASPNAVHHRWFLGASVGPSFGALGTTPSASARGGINLTPSLAVQAEWSAFRNVPFADAAAVAPPIAPDLKQKQVEAYTANVNLMVHPFTGRRVSPYATVGIGSFTSDTLSNDPMASVDLFGHARSTDLATNVGAGVSYQLNRWLGVGLDYRHFFVDAASLQHVNRVAAGVTLGIK